MSKVLKIIIIPVRHQQHVANDIANAYNLQDNLSFETLNRCAASGHFHFRSRSNSRGYNPQLKWIIAAYRNPALQPGTSYFTMVVTI